MLVVLLLPALFASMLLVFDGSRVTTESRSLQHMADAAALVAADELYRAESTSTAITAAEANFLANDDLANGAVQVNIPPTSGEFTGSSRHAEIIINRPLDNYFGGIFQLAQDTSLSVRAVAGIEPATDDAAIVVLDEDPPPLKLLQALPIIPSLPTLIGGFEILGLGRVTVDGAVLVNNTWGGEDEFGLPAGLSQGPPYAVACTPILPLAKLQASDLRVAGGVDRRQNYRGHDGDYSTMLRAGSRPVPDPLREVPPPTVSVDPVNIVDNYYGGKTIVGLPLIGPPTLLRPGVYEWINIVTGNVIFEPGVYVIRSKSPLTQLSLTMLAANVQAHGVMFYITDNNSYSVHSPGVDAFDGETHPGNVGALELLPSAVINIGVLGSSYSPLNSPSSPYDGMMIYQRRHDRRPIVLVQENLLGPGTISGTLYSKWGHLLLAGKGTFDTRIVTGTLRIIALLDVDIAPTWKLDPAYEVYLVE
ncbi:pilus assembly protein TadG-related protein [Blastopirellula sp. J2-11]|uniref:pilus assembly protein TadG-related protein n=1 Tax=Blastopirellula sp. J2-11 TaxID=2943192 RepID=UPI0021C570CF|nr:pilus assembly protein TadG-related protein [Blastopirellula sp. J2-11]UUO07226.1 pilus assembly protein TadG-related protein [Blastopirellula sp. J2-11]